MLWVFNNHKKISKAFLKRKLFPRQMSFIQNIKKVKEQMRNKRGKEKYQSHSPYIFSSESTLGSGLGKEQKCIHLLELWLQGGM